MKLYDCKTAPSPRRVRIFVAEKGIDLDVEQIDLRSGEQFSPAFRAINPDCVVPVLELDDGKRLTEVFAICQFLEEHKPEPVLLGATAFERAQVTMWNIKIEQQGFAAIAETFRNSANGLANRAVTGPNDFEQIPELAARGRERTGLFLEMLDAQLNGNAFVAGDNYSIADISAMVVVDFANWVKISLPETAVHLRRWYDAVSARPSANA